MADPRGVKAMREEENQQMQFDENAIGDIFIDLKPRDDIPAVPAIEYYLGQAQRQLEQVERHLQDGETISHREKVFSIFETHTRWKQKASRA